MAGEVEKVEERESLFQWKVKWFSSLDDQVGSYCDSRPFHFCGRRWRLYLLPNGGEQNQREGHIVLGLFLLDRDPPAEVRYSLGIRTAEGRRGIWTTGTHTFDDDNQYVHGRGIHRSELLRRRDELLPRDVLTVALTLKVEDGPSETVLKSASVRETAETNVADVFVQKAVEDNVASGGKVEPSEKTGPEKIAEDVGKLWPNGDYTDVLLKVKDVEFKAHRTILSARTPALGAMFQHDTAERASGEVIIDDCEPEVFEQLLYYIYKGAPRELTAENASALYVVADKYLVSEVKALCVRCMQDSLCSDTFCDTLTLSLMYGEDELLKTAADFFSRNMVDVLKTVEWQRFMGEHKTWANEVLIRATQLTEARHEKEKTSSFRSCYALNYIPRLLPETFSGS